ncbi:hypothetical protein GCM10011414_09330 [Croceivirga lutea]|uniref:Dabb family protein n=1 Tax=Croceivirga lutea TaxID=1775167 RepID=UPI00163AAEA5|nr:Dabb family protein [Croceivirga lutea]GGG41934.1 hypothetical protein GCM10011414_09330 [Croceivirga lutea]
MKKLLLAFLLICCFTTMNAQDTSTEFDPTYAHVVYFWFNEPDNEEHRVAFEKSLQKFLSSSKYAKTNFIGTPPKAIREVVDDSFTYNLIVSFESAEAQQAYQDEEVHKVFIAECESFWKKVIVYDANTIDK